MALIFEPYKHTVKSEAKIYAALSGFDESTDINYINVFNEIKNHIVFKCKKSEQTKNSFECSNFFNNLRLLVFHIHCSYLYH